MILFPSGCLTAGALVFGMPVFMSVMMCRRVVSVSVVMFVVTFMAVRTVVAMLVLFAVMRVIVRMVMRVFVLIAHRRFSWRLFGEEAREGARWSFR
jgi:glycerol-3-phosphate acyltransferase PlsY